jgi:hypothetical protein
MNSIPSYRDFALHSPASLLRPVPERPRRGLLRRIFKAIEASHERRAEREVARRLGIGLGEPGEHLTDEMERRLFEHLTRNRNFRP